MRHENLAVVLGSRKLNDSDFHTVHQILDSNIVMDSSEQIQNWFLGEKKNVQMSYDITWQHI